MSVQFIEKDGKPEWAIVPYADYEKLLAAAEELADVQDFDSAKTDIANATNLVPATVTFAILDGMHPITAWRKERKLTLQALADKAEISKAYLSQIEAGKRTGSIDVLQRLANGLSIGLEQITE